MSDRAIPFNIASDSIIRENLYFKDFKYRKMMINQHAYMYYFSFLHMFMLECCGCAWIYVQQLNFI